MLRRTKNIVLKDEIEIDEPVSPQPERTTSTRFDRQYPEAWRVEMQAAAPRAERLGLDALRAEAQRFVVANDDPDEPGVSRRHLKTPFKPSRLLLILVALIAGGVAAYLVVQQLNFPAASSTTVVIHEVAPTPPLPITTQVLVATRSIGIGQRMSADLVEWKPWPAEAIREDYLSNEVVPDAPATMDGSVARFEFFAGEPIREEKLVRAEDGYLSAILEGGMRGVSVRVSAASASGGFIVPNDRVDVVSTRISENGQISQTILQNIRVLAINTRLGETGTTGEPTDPDDPRAEIFIDDALATLELNPTQAEVIINASTMGQLTLVLRSMVDFADSTNQPASDQAIRILSPFWSK